MTDVHIRVMNELLLIAIRGLHTAGEPGERRLLVRKDVLWPRQLRQEAKRFRNISALGQTIC